VSDFLIYFFFPPARTEIFFRSWRLNDPSLPLLFSSVSFWSTYPITGEKCSSITPPYRPSSHTQRPGNAWRNASDCLRQRRSVSMYFSNLEGYLSSFLVASLISSLSALLLFQRRWCPESFFDSPRASYERRTRPKKPQFSRYLFLLKQTCF